MLITLLSDGALEYARCVDLFRISRRQFQRDIRRIRELGRPHGFAVSQSKSGRVLLGTTSRRIANLSAKSRDATATLARLAAAFGGPIAQEMRGVIGDAEANTQTGFLQVREPRPAASDCVTRVFEELKAAAVGPARVEFDYTSARGPRSRRRVEPYHIVARTGRYYLVAYDLGRRDWRHFALDAIDGRLLRSGTFTPRRVPERFLAERAVGWISGSQTTDVTIRIGPLIAAAICARVWQRGQQVRRLSDGGAEMTLAFEDLGEAARWTLQFGTEAVILAPSEAVALARETATRIANAYAAEKRELRAGRRSA
jgi:predicted DNA-binding transcriptional regulator YafY